MQTFEKSDRLRKRAQYLAVQNQGKRVHSRCLLAIHAKEPKPCSLLEGSKQGRRLGITVSRRVGNAVVRNRVKRWIKEAWRRNWEVFPPQKEVVIVAKKDAGASSFGKIEKETIQLGQRIFQGRSKVGAVR